MAGIRIYRAGQIGGCVTEIINGEHRIIIDFGANLPGAPEDAMSDEEVIREVFGTDSAPKGADAVLFTHYHGDHVGLKTRLRGTEPFSCDPKRKNVSEKRFDVADPDMYLKKGFVMLVRPNRNPDLEMGRFEQWMQPMKDPFITYSLWDGYLEDGKTPREDIVQFMKGKNDDAHRRILHTSGHAYVETLKKLMDLTEPEVIIPMHTESIEAFKSLPLFKEYKDRMTELTDGEVFPL